MVSPQKQIESILPGPIAEIILDVSCDRVAQILHRTRSCALACAREIRLQGPSAAVRFTHHIGVIGPDIPEECREGRVIICVLAGPKDTEVGELAREHPAREHGLDHVCAVEAVHAICAHDGRLRRARLEAALRVGRQV